MLLLSLTAAMAFGAVSAGAPSPSTPPPLIVQPARHAHAPDASDADLRNSLALGCRDGSQGNCYELANMLNAGRGGPADPKRAHALLIEACRKGFVRACGDKAR